MLQAVAFRNVESFDLTTLCRGSANALTSLRVSGKALSTASEGIRREVFFTLDACQRLLCKQSDARNEATMNDVDTKLTKAKLTADILFVLRHLYSPVVDQTLIENGANERCLAARFFAYMMNLTSCAPDYRKLTWDPEYNRHGHDTKKLDGSEIVPDLILHHRGDDTANILVVEFKKTGRSLKSDRVKLTKLTDSSCYFRYRLGVLIVLGIDKVTLEWFRDGITFSFETYRTDTWQSTSFLDDDKPSEHRRCCTLMITRSCNLNCRYCYEPFKSNDRKLNMSFETAQKILRGEFELVRKSDTFDEIEIDFMGGEPLMNFPLIRKIVEWLEREPPPVPYICFATTNGTLVSRHEKWLRVHTTHLQLGASYDGTTEMQRANRGTSNNSVNLALIHNLYPRQGFHMVISRDTLPYLADGVLEMQRKGYKLEAALAQGEDWTETDAKIYRGQLEKLARSYLGRDRTLKPINLLMRPLVTIADNPTDVKQKKFCGTGTHMVTYDYDGKIYGCHLFTPVVLGDKAKEVKDIDYACEESQSDSYCAECRLKGICPTCAGFNYRYRGSLGARDHRWCHMILEQTKVACAFQIKRIAKDKFHTEEELAYAKHVLEAYPILEQISHEAIPPYVV